MDVRGKRFLADRLYDVMWIREELKKKGVKTLIRTRRNAVGRENIDDEEYKERGKIESLFGNVKMKLSGFVATYREDMIMVLALVKFLAYNLYVLFFPYIIFGTAPVKYENF